MEELLNCFRDLFNKNEEVFQMISDFYKNRNDQEVEDDLDFIIANSFRTIENYKVHFESHFRNSTLPEDIQEVLNEYFGYDWMKNGDVILRYLLSGTS
jgi:hypothetical protein